MEQNEEKLPTHKSVEKKFQEPKHKQEKENKEILPEFEKSNQRATSPQYSLASLPLAQQTAR